MQAKFVHTNIIAQDWRKLADFYEQVLGCTPVPPERNLSGQWLETGTRVTEVEIRGMHLRLPGYDEQGPTLEIFHYNPQLEPLATAINRPGFSHIAFAVNNVQTARDAVLAAGGGTVGEIVSVDVPGVGTVTFVYLTDPEGNIIELQHWSR
ncbi:MAG: VOC family protein [Chloroflexi bacterium]|nr:VOC family protein [Chloroflexota bacterium]